MSLRLLASSSQMAFRFSAPGDLANNSISLWCRPTAVANAIGTYTPLFGLVKVGVAEVSTIGIYVDGAGNRHFYAYQTHPTSGGCQTVGKTVIAAGELYHVAAVLDQGSGASQYWSLYVNGSIDTPYYSTFPNTPGGYPSAWTVMGYNYILASPLWYDGQLMHCAYWRGGLLTAEQVRTLYGGGLPCDWIELEVQPSYLAEYYPMTWSGNCGAVVTSLRDYGPYGYHLTTSNSPLLRSDIAMSRSDAFGPYKYPSDFRVDYLDEAVCSERDAMNFGVPG